MLNQYRSLLGDMFLINPYFNPLPNIAKTLDQVIAAAKGS